MLDGLFRRVHGADSFTGAAVAYFLRGIKCGGVLLRSALLAVGLAFLPGLVAAQSGDTLLVKVRLDRGGFLMGRGFVTRPDTLTFVPDGRADTLMLAFDSIRALRGSRGEQSHFWAGLIIGVGVGAALGATAGYMGGDNEPDPSQFIDLTASAGMRAYYGALIGGALGAVTGGIVGGSIRTPRFVRIGEWDLRLETRIGADESPGAPKAP